MDQDIGSTLHKFIFISANTFGVRVSLITYTNQSKQGANLDPKLDARIHKISSSSLTWSLDTSRSERPKIFNHCILHGMGIPKICTTEKALFLTQNPFPLIKLFSHFHRELLNQPCKPSRPHRQFSKSTLSTKVNATHAVYANQTPVLL